MIDQFQKILEVVFSLSGQESLLVLIPEDSGSQVENRFAGSFYIPRDLFPPFAEVHKLPGYEQMPAAIKNLVIERHPTKLFIIPPFLSTRFLSPQIRADFPGLGLAEILLKLLALNSNSGTQIGALLPQNTLNGESTRPFREQLLFANTLRWCIFHDHPWPTFNIHSSFRMNTLVFEVGKSTDSTLRFFKVPTTTAIEQTDKVIGDLKKLAKQGGGRTDLGYVMREGLSSGVPLLFDLYDPQVLARQKDMDNFGTVRRLGELVESVRVINLSKDINLLQPEESAEGIPLLEGRDIRADGTIAYKDTRHRAKVSSEQQLRVGDICIRAIQGVADKFTVAEVQEEMIPLTAANSVIVLRPKPSLNPEDREFIVSYLKSKRAMEFFRAGSVNIHIPISTLLELQVPVPDATLILALQSLNQSSKQFGEWKFEVDQIRDSLFEYTSVKDARLKILSSGRLARQRQEAARMAEDFRYRVRTQFPYPLAFRWRGIEATLPTLEGYLQVLECAEITFTFLASVAILVSKSVGTLEIKWISEMAKRLSGESAHGTNMGDWITILHEVAESKEWRKIPDQTPFYEVVRLLGDTETVKAVRRLKQRRDDQSHLRGPKDGKGIQNAFQEVLRDLEFVLHNADFLSEYPMRFIETTRWDSFQKTTYYDYRELAGDHYLVPLAHGKTNTPDLEAKSLYLVDRNGTLHLLRPLITQRECPTCGKWSHYYLDTYDKKSGTVVLKSLEHEHTIRDVEIAEAFKQIGLLL